MYFMVMVLNAVIFNIFKFIIIIIMLTSTPWSLFYLFIRFELFFQLNYNRMLLTTMGVGGFSTHPMTIYF